MTRWHILIAVGTCIVIAAIVLVALPGTTRAPSPAAPAHKGDLIVLDSPLPGSEISSPLVVRGRARGPWYFEADFPVLLTDWDGRIIATVPAHATQPWMTEEYVPFEAVLEFKNPSWGDGFSKRGTLILKKDNPSGLPEHDDALEVPVVFK